MKIYEIIIFGLWGIWRSHLPPVQSGRTGLSEEGVFQLRKYPQRNNLCNLLFIVTLIGYPDRENQDVQSNVCRGYSVTGPKINYLTQSILRKRVHRLAINDPPSIPLLSYPEHNRPANPTHGTDFSGNDDRPYELL